ncbi:DNA methyltransferase [Sphingorhabdus sp. Alg231-15]|uniref:DNA methyltransferase n=1 Tax=Sphingorhabdus sp. Alg231-15 TaxID=1922222 RepID=UPI000D55C126
MNHFTRRLAEKIISQKLSDLKPYAGNARKHSAKQIDQIAKSIKQFGFTNPVLVDEHNNVIAGHGRIAAAKKLDISDVPTACITGLSEADRKAYIIADNRLAELADWDDDLLKLELEGILDLEPDFDPDSIGFSDAEVTKILEPLEAVEPEDAVPDVDPTVPAVTKSGDIWQLGNHRLICGDSLLEQTYISLMAGDTAQMIFTDPPYNVPVGGHVCGLGKIKHNEFAMASGEMTSEEFTGFLKNCFKQLAKHSDDGSIHYICMDWRHMSEILAAGGSHYTELKNLIVWNKDNGGMGSFYRSKHELIFAFKSGSAKHINNFELGQHGRYRTNVWDYAGINSLKEGRDEELAMHPTVKPTQLVADAILDCSKRGGIILDAFSGSGTTIIAAEQTGRHCRAIELDPHYCDVAIKRWQSMTGKQAVHVGLDAKFDDLRSSPPN